MIGILFIPGLPDPDDQHGSNLSGWIAGRGCGRARTIRLDRFPEEDPTALPGLWWHHAPPPPLPGEALTPEVIEGLRTFVIAGGKLFLSRGAAALVEALGLGPAPDRLRTRPPRFFLRPGLRAPASRHPLLEGLPSGIKTYGFLDLEAFSDLGWSLPATAGTNEDRDGTFHEDGNFLGDLAFRELNGAVFKDESVLREWRLGRGRVLAFGGVALNIYDHEDRYREGLEAFVSAITKWLELPVTIEVAPLSVPETSTRENAPFPSFRDAYEMKRLGASPLAFAPDRLARVEAVIDPFRLASPALRMALTREGRLLADRKVLLAPRYDGLLAGTLTFDPEDLDGNGLYTLEAMVTDQGRTVGESMRPLMIRDPAPTPMRITPETIVLTEGRAVLELDVATGCVKGLYASDHPFGVNYGANETNSILTEEDPAPWLGTVQGRYRTAGHQAWIPFTNRSKTTVLNHVDKDHASWCGRPEGTDLDLGWSFARRPEGIRWTFTLANDGDAPIEVGSLAIPASFNTYFGLEWNQERTYRRRVMMHNLVCGEGSYLFAEPLAGKAPFLCLIPEFGEGFEMMWHDRDRFAGRQPAWEGLLYAGIFTLAEQEALEIPEWYQGHRSMTLKPGSRRSFAFTLSFVDRYEDVAEGLLAAGKPVLDPHPGMVVPEDMPARFRIRCRVPFEVEGGEGLRIELAGSEEDGQDRDYALAFDGPGEYPVIVRTRHGTSRYWFRAIPPLKRLIEARGRFIAERQRYRNPGAYRDGAFLMWDAETRDLVVEPKHAFLAGGSDEVGFADPVFLSAKQLFQPEPREVEALEDYVDRFLFGKVQSRKDYGVKRWVAEPGREDHAVEGHDIGLWTDRSFNYPHVFNIYLALHVAGKRYGMLSRRTPERYLEMAARTVLAYFAFGECLNAALEQGNLGDRALTLVIDRLDEEGMTALRDEVARAVTRKIRHMKSAPYPYASEYAFDTTGYEGVYWLRKAAGDGEGVDEVLETILATRGKQPFWYHFADDVRWGWGNSKFECPDEICFNYMCGLNARVLMDAFLHVRPDPLYLRLGFAGSVAPWVLVDEDGTAHDFRGWEPGRVRADPWSSEMGIGIAPTLFALASVVVFHARLGYEGYGCRVERNGDTLRIEPRDGVGRRIVLMTEAEGGFAITSDRARILEARFEESSMTLEMDLEGAMPGVSECTIRVEGLHDRRRPEDPRILRVPLTPEPTRCEIALDGRD